MYNQHNKTKKKQDEDRGDAMKIDRPEAAQQNRLLRALPPADFALPLTSLLYRLVKAMSSPSPVTLLSMCIFPTPQSSHTWP